MKAVLFLDRDGTINVDRGGGTNYISTPEMLELVPGAADAVIQAKEAGFKISLITNQAGVAKGITPLEMIPVIHDHLEKMIMNESRLKLKEPFRFDDIRVCPHHPDDKCKCRKPGIKMLQDSITALDADLSTSWFIGDHTRDLQTAQNAGVKSILVLTGHGQASQKEISMSPSATGPHPHAIVDDLKAAVEWILRHS